MHFRAESRITPVGRLGCAEQDRNRWYLGDFWEIEESLLLVCLALCSCSLPNYFCWLAFFSFKNTVFWYIETRRSIIAAASTPTAWALLRFPALGATALHIAASW